MKTAILIAFAVFSFAFAQPVTSGVTHPQELATTLANELDSRAVPCDDFTSENPYIEQYGYGPPACFAVPGFGDTALTLTGMYLDIQGLEAIKPWDEFDNGISYRTYVIAHGDYYAAYMATIHTASEDGFEYGYTMLTFAGIWSEDFSERWEYEFVDEPEDKTGGML